MAAIGLAEAARLSGKNQSTIHRAMKTGRLSYSVGPAGERQIDPAELDRVFGIKMVQGNGASPPAMAQPMQSNSAHEGELAALQRLLDDRDATIRDLRARLDAESAERRRVQERLTGLLTHRSAGSVPVAGSPRRPWWRRWGR